MNSSSHQQPYSSPLRRDLSGEEKHLLQFILSREAPSRLEEIDNLKVVARCGCGSCPTVIFGTSRCADPSPARPFKEIAEYWGRNAIGVLVAVSLLERQGRISELEAWSPEGAEITAWPEPSTLERITGPGDVPS